LAEGVEGRIEVEPAYADVVGNVIEVAELDLLDGTPVLDIKPYVPEYDAYQDEPTGWLETSPRAQVSVGDGRFEIEREAQNPDSHTPR
jgi:tRNA (Thr-GGU) A37 N-methylase